MLPMHVFRLHYKVVTTFDFVIVNTLYAIYILYSHIKITHVSRPEKEVYPPKRDHPLGDPLGVPFDSLFVLYSDNFFLLRKKVLSPEAGSSSR